MESLPSSREGKTMINDHKYLEDHKDLFGILFYMLVKVVLGVMSLAFIIFLIWAFFSVVG